jgi:hypothetical protein
VAANETTTTTELRWDITPADFLEDGTLPVDMPLGKWGFDKQQATLLLATAEDPITERTETAARRELESILFSRCILIDRHFNLSERPAITQQTPTGKNFILPVGAGHLRMQGSAIDLTIKDDVALTVRDDLVITEMETGKVLIDTAAQRLAAHKTHAETNAPIIAGSDALFYMHKSYCQSLADPDNAFVHLGEIKDTLSKTLGGAKAAEAVLPGSAWNTLGRIANALPVNESRHRGAHFDQLRAATEVELEEARAAAKQLIDAYKKLI